MGFYGEPDTSRRHELWELLCRLKHNSTLPWLCASDFNKIVTVEPLLILIISKHSCDVY